jgi:RHS repeat-associated protein
MQPSLALVYNSRSGDGIAGMGWTISGQSSIHRCPQTPEQDDSSLASYVPAVTYSADDRLCLDGQRLVKVGGTYGLSGAEYRTEVDSYARITQTGGNLTGAATCFRVEQKDGRILHYGAVTGADSTGRANGCIGGTSRVQPTGGAATLSWQLEKVEDRSGNTQTFAYHDYGNGENLLQTVTYTGYGTTDVGDRTVTFAYVSRTTAASAATDVSSSYLAGGLIMQTQALQKITTALAGTAVRTYTPSYAVLGHPIETYGFGGRLLMTDLQECATNASGTACHPATHFLFNDSPLNYSVKSLSGVLPTPASFPANSSANPNQLAVIADLDGDGTREVAATAPVSASEPNHLFLIQMTGDRVAQDAVDLTGTAFKFASNLYADIDGDGRTELIEGSISGSLSFGVWIPDRGTAASTVALPNLTAQQRFDALFKTVSSNITIPTQAPFGQRRTLFAADLDGDGRTDVLVVRPVDPGDSIGCGSPDAIGAQDAVYFYRNTTAKLLGSAQQPTAVFAAPASRLFCLSRTVNTGGGTFHEDSIEHIADFDGNGLPDFYLVRGGDDGPANAPSNTFVGVRSTTRTSTGVTTTLSTPLFCDGAANSLTDQCSGVAGYATHWMDVNGDGLEDFVIARPNQQTWRIRLNKGGGALGAEIDTASSVGLNVDSGAGTPSGKSFRYANSLPTMDVDADGKADLLIPSQLAGSQAFAVKMCQIQKVPPLSGGENCPVAGAASSSGSSEQVQYCLAYSCSENPDGSPPMPPNSTTPSAFPYQWNNLPAFAAHSTASAHNGPGGDSSVYHLATLKFAQTGAAAFQVKVIETPLISRLNDSIGRADDLFGDGLQDLTTSVGCSDLDVTNGVVTYPLCSAVDDGTYGPTTFDSAATSTFAGSVVLYASINQGPPFFGGSPGVQIAASRHLTPVGFATTSPKGSLLPLPFMPGLLDGVTNGVNDGASWGYAPLSVPVPAEGYPGTFYSVRAANGYADSRHYYFQSSMPVAWGIAQSNGIGGLNGFRSAFYGYTEAMYNHFGRGFQGFRTITSTGVFEDLDHALRTQTTTTYEQKFPLTGRVIGIDTVAVDSGVLVRKETDRWACDRLGRVACKQGDVLVVPTSSSVLRPFLDEQLVENFDLANGHKVSQVDTVNAASAAATKSGWDDTACDANVQTGSTEFGNLNAQSITSSDVTYSGDTSAGAFVTSHVTTSTNCYDLLSSTNWWVNALKSNSVIRSMVYAGTHTLPGGASASTQTLATNYTWNTNRTPKTKVVQPTVVNQQSTTTWTYPPATSYGLPTQVAVNAPDLDSAHSPTRTTSYTYTKDGSSADAAGYFILTATNGLSYTTKTEIAANDGQVARTTNPNGVQTKVTYDPFGRATQIDHLDNSTNHAAFESSIQAAYTSCRSAAGDVGHCPSKLPGEDAWELQAAYRVTVSQEGHAVQVTWYDPLGRVVKHAEQGFDGSYIATLTDYTLNGPVYQTSTPYFVGGSVPPFFTSWAYDALNRPFTKVNVLDLTNTNLVTDYSYSGRTATITVRDSSIELEEGLCPASATNLCLQMTRSTNVLGQLMQTTESPGGLLQTTNYWTEPQGHTAATSDPESKVIKATYNALGQRIASTDPDQGAWTFTYDALGELLTQTDARGVVTTINKRDVLGRTTEQQALPPAIVPVGLANDTVVDQWTFDPTNALGELGLQRRLRGSNRTTPLSNPEVWKESYGYEPLTARPSTITTTISEGIVQALSSSMHYDSDGRPDTYTYPSGLVVRRTYTDQGQLSQLSNDATGTVYWTATAANEWGHVTGETFAGNLTGTHEDYNSTGQAYKLSWSGGGLGDAFTYGYDSFGNLKSQTRVAPGASNNENYTYDPLQRLIRAARGTGSPVSYDYTSSGNLKYKSDYSTSTGTPYTYGGAGSGCGPHAVSQVSLSGGGTATYTCDANGNVIGGSTLNMTFDADNHPRIASRTLTIPSTLACRHADTIFCYGHELTTSVGSATWTYAATGDRDAEVSGGVTRYFGPEGYEQVGTKKIHELGPVIVSRTGTTDTISLVLKDRLGSTLDTIDGSLIARRSYDAFGAARNGDMSSRLSGTLNLSDTIHGFTDHTHADDVAMVHMKGRVYDYFLGRFLSVDRAINGTANSQGLNPYSYIGNNPLSGTDPTGYDCQEDSSGQVATSCLRSNDGINKITDATGKEVGTVILASKGDNITISGNGGSINSTFTGKTGDVSRLLNGPPSDVGAIGALTNGTLDGMGASYGIGPDKVRSPMVDLLAQAQQAKRSAEWDAYRQHTFAHEGMHPTSLLIDAPIGDLADFLNIGQRQGFITKAAGIGFLGVALDIATLGRGGAVTGALEKSAIRGLEDGALVCRGGICTADRFANGTGVVLDSAGNLNGVSVNSAAETSLEELTKAIPNKKIGVTTVGDVRRAGGDVVPSPTDANIYHCTLCGITPQKAEELFTPVVPNPNGG